MTATRPLFIATEPGTLHPLLARHPAAKGMDILCHEDDAGVAATAPCQGVVTAYGGGNLAPCRADLDGLRHTLGPLAHRQIYIATDGDVPPHVRTVLRLLQGETVIALTPAGSLQVPLPTALPRDPRSLLLKACGGIGNLVLLTPLVAAALEAGWRVTFCPVSDADGASLASLFDNADLPGLRCIPPEEALHAAADVTMNIEAQTLRAQHDYHHNPFRVGIAGHEPQQAAQFFTNVTDLPVDISRTFIGRDITPPPEELQGRIVVCPGSKSGWDSKRWPHMDAFLRTLEDPVVLCRQGDLAAYRELGFLTPISAPNATFLTDRTLPQAASLLASARAVVANDCGLAHMAAATGVPTVILFGPSSLKKNRHPRPNVHSLSLALDCQPCQGRADGPGQLAPHQYFCDAQFACLADLAVTHVLEALEQALGAAAGPEHRE